MKKNELVRNKIRTWLIVTTAIFGVLTILSLPVILISPMMYDAPGSVDVLAINITFYSLVTFPVMVIISMILEWVLFRFQKLKGALIISFFPFLNIFLFLAGLILWY